jgi:uncharacterized membrane protein YbaN (DUF454 family)
MGDVENSGSDSRLDPGLRAKLRLASFAFPSSRTILVILGCRRGHFSKSNLPASAFALASSACFARYFDRRSRDLAANLGYSNAGPDRDPGYNDQSDVAAILCAIALVIFGAYMLITHW